MHFAISSSSSAMSRLSIPRLTLQLKYNGTTIEVQNTKVNNNYKKPRIIAYKFQTTSRQLYACVYVDAWSTTYTLGQHFPLSRSWFDEVRSHSLPPNKQTTSDKVKYKEITNSSEVLSTLYKRLVSSIRYFAILWSFSLIALRTPLIIHQSQWSAQNENELAIIFEGPVCKW